MTSFFSAADISASGLAAERTRMQVIANNVANANSTHLIDDEPYRRQVAVFAPVLQDQLFGGDAAAGGGVRVLGIEEVPGELAQIYEPNHPDANEAGFVQMPNVSIAKEMVEMISASRAYEANLQSLRNLRTMVENSLSLLRAT